MFISGKESKVRKIIARLCVTLFMYMSTFRKAIKVYET